MSKNLTRRIAIIGAGASGLTAGLELKRRGFTHVVIFEKEQRVGGKTFSYTHKKNHFDLGSMMFSRASAITRLADRYHIPYTSFETEDVYYSKGTYVSPLAYARESYSLFAILRSLFRLRKIIASNHLAEAGYHDIDPDLYQDFQSYLKKHHLEAAAKAFEPAISGLGYGYFKTTAAVYNLKIMASMVDLSLIRSVLSNGNHMCFFPGGWMELWERIAADLDVRTGSDITSIKRTAHNGVIISVNGTTEVFDTLIITTPLNHANAYLDLSKKENALFNKIQSHRMITTLVEGSIALKTSFIADNATPKRIGHVLGFECYAPETRCSVLFQTAPKDMPTEEINRIISEDLQKMGCKVMRIILQKEWDYFYHVSSKDLADGFYDALNALQGTHNTFYMGSIFNYETIDHCQQFAKHIVEKHF